MNYSNRLYRVIGLATVLSGVMLSGTVSAHEHKQTLGIIIGATAGGLLGSQISDDGHRNRYNHNRVEYRVRADNRHDNRRSYYNRRFDNPGYYRRNYNDRRFDIPRYDRRVYNNRNYYNRGNDSTQLIATATGVFIGALIGSEIGRYMDDVDQMRAREANARARTAPVGSQISWNNPRTNHSGSITATRDGYSESGRYCREFYQTVNIGGRTEEAYGVACQQPDGAWQIVQPAR